MKPFNERSVFGFGVADDNIIGSDHKDIGNLTLCREGLTRTGRTQNQAVGVFEQLAVNHNEVVGKSVDTAVQSFLSGLEQLLGGKGYKNSDA